MKQTFILLATILLYCASCNQNNKPTTTAEKLAKQDTGIDKAASSHLNGTLTDTTAIQTLIRQMLNKVESGIGSKNIFIDLMPVISKDSVYVGIDFKTHKQNLAKLSNTGFFTDAFIENYNQTILSIDKKLRNKTGEAWLVGDMAPFDCLGGDADAWTLTQDVPYDKPNPFDFVKVIVLKNDENEAECEWKWGNLKKDTDVLFKNFSYKFNVKKEGGKWKVDYLQGFYGIKEN